MVERFVEIKGADHSLVRVVIRRRRCPFKLASQDIAGATWPGYHCRHVAGIPLAPCGHGL